MARHIAVTVALVADTHGHLDMRIADRVARCDWAVHAGDIGNAAVLRELRPRERHVIAVRGNNDIAAKWPAADRDLLESLPQEALLDLPGGTLAVVHGHRAGALAQRHDYLRDRYPAARAIVYGHSHRLVCDQDASLWVLNPGAAGRARTFGGPSCLILHAGPRIWRCEVCRFPPAEAGQAAS